MKKRVQKWRDRAQSWKHWERTAHWAQAIRKLIFDDVLGLAAQTAFFLLLSIFPLGLFCASILTHFNLYAEAPASVLPIELVEIINSAPALSRGMTPILILGSLWSGSAGLFHMIKAVHLAYTNEVLRSPWARVAGIGYMLVFLVALALSYMLLSFGRWFSIIGSVLAVYLLLFSLYRLDFRRRKDRPAAGSRRFAPVASLLGAVLWSLATHLFELYMSQFSRYTFLYGSIGTVLALALWLYIISCIVVFCAEVGAILGALFPRPGGLPPSEPER